MNIEQYIAFLVTSVLLIIIPGPNVLVVVGTSVSHGVAKGLQTVAGTTAAMAIQLLVAALAAAGVIAVLAKGFLLIKWLGVAYLLFLALKHFRSAMQTRLDQPSLSGGGSFARGFLVSLTNPKTIVFFAAFLPQFIAPQQAALPQLLLLSLSFLLLAVLLDSLYAFLAGKIAPLIKRHYRLRFSNIVTGCTYLLASAWLALTKRC